MPTAKGRAPPVEPQRIERVDDEPDRRSAPGFVETLKDPAPAYAELARIVLGGQPVNSVMQRIAELARDTIPGAKDVSVTLITRGRARSVAFAGDLAAFLDERQYEAGFGPCTDAAVTGQTISIPDTAADLTYPDFSRVARRKGVRHVMAIGFPTMQEVSGAMNVYGTAAGGGFDRDADDIATGFASYAGVALANAAMHAGALEEVQQMRQAMASRAVIEQAKGIIMGTRRCTADDAFAILRDASTRSNRKLRDIAAALVEDATS